jgi:hypothetical protein
LLTDEEEGRRKSGTIIVQQREPQIDYGDEAERLMRVIIEVYHNRIGLAKPIAFLLGHEVLSHTGWDSRMEAHSPSSSHL